MVGAQLRYFPRPEKSSACIRSWMPSFLRNGGSAHSQNHDPKRRLEKDFIKGAQNRNKLSSRNKGEGGQEVFYLGQINPTQRLRVPFFAQLSGGGGRSVLKAPR